MEDRECCLLNPKRYWRMDGGERKTDPHSPKSKEEVTRREEPTREEIGGCVSNERSELEMQNRKRDVKKRDKILIGCKKFVNKLDVGEKKGIRVNMLVT